MKKAILAIATLSIFSFADEKGDAIAKRFYNLKSSTSSISSANMILINKKGKKKVRKMEMKNLDVENGSASYIEFTSPANVAGTKFLILPDEKGESVQRIYLPALKKVRLIAGGSKKGSFVGSDFSYYDLEDRNFEDATYKWLREEAIDGETYDVVEMVSKDIDSPYSKSIAFIKKSNGFIYKSEFYDKRKGKLIKKLSIIETKLLDGIIVPTKLVMDDKKDGSKTLLISSGVSVNSAISKDVFTIQNLKK